MIAIKGVEYENYYTVYAACFNCDFTGEVDVLKGKVFGLAHCPLCGCTTLVKKDGQNTIRHTRDM